MKPAPKRSPSREVGKPDDEDALGSDGGLLGLAILMTSTLAKQTMSEIDESATSSRERDDEQEDLRRRRRSKLGLLLRSPHRGTVEIYLLKLDDTQTSATPD
ncbi:hypothetical protein ACLB2K_023919 [Fragaria x ananassa]